jgi:hypothetical protein
MATRGKIVVRGRNIMRPPLLETEDAEIIEIHDQFGDLMGLLTRIQDDVWGLTTRQDEDWNEVCVRYGYQTPQGSMEQVIARGSTI